MLLTYVWMYAKGAILREKIRIYMSSVTSSRSFIITYPVGLEENTRRKWVAREKGDFRKNYWPHGCRHAPSIPELNAWVALIHVGKKCCNSRSWVGRLARLRTSLRQALR